MQGSGFFSATTSTTYLYFTRDDGFTLPPSSFTVPIDSPSSADTSVPVHFPGADAAAAVKIQSAYRAHLVRSLVRLIRDVDAEAGRFERLIREQDTVDAVRRDERERLRVSEGLMALLLRLDAVPGFYPAVRELRRSASRRIVALQDLLDAIVGESVSDPEGFPSSWEEVVWGVGVVGGGAEEEVCVDSAEETEVKRGLRCLERLLLL